MAGSVERPDDGTGAGADDVIGNDAMRFKHLDHADMRETAGGTAAEGKADLRLGDGRLGSRLRAWSGAAGEQRDDNQQQVGKTQGDQCGCSAKKQHFSACAFGLGK